MVPTGQLDSTAAAASADPAAAQAEAKAEAATAAADAAVRQSLSADAVHSSDAAQPLAAGMQDKRNTGASEPRTGSAEATAAADTTQGVASASATAGPSVVPPDLQPVSALPARDHRTASAPLSGSSLPASSAAQAHAAASGHHNNVHHASPSPLPGQLPNGQARRANLGHTLVQPANHSVQQAGHQHLNGSAPLSNVSSQTDPTVSKLNQTGIPGNGAGVAPAIEQHGHAASHADDDNDSLEDGEIEEGEMLPDGTIAGPPDDAQTSELMHDASSQAVDKPKRAAPEENGHEHGHHPAKRHHDTLTT